MKITGEQLKNLRESKGVTQSVLADALKRSRNTIATWEKEGNSVTKYDDIKAICDYFKIDISDLPDSGVTLISTGEGQGIGSIDDKDDDKTLIPVYDIDILAGKADIELFNDGGVQPSYYMDIPEYAGCAAFRVYSDSMAPLIAPGSIMFCRPVNNWQDYLEFGQIYAIQTIDYRRFLKYIRKSKKSDTFLLRSHNENEYDDFEISTHNVLSVWLVEGWLRKRTQ